MQANQSKRFLATKRFFVNLTRPTHQHNEDLPSKSKSSDFGAAAKSSGGGKGSLKVNTAQQQS